MVDVKVLEDVDAIGSLDFNAMTHEFDFDRVKKAMDALSWNYTGKPVTVDELKEIVWTLYEGFNHWDSNARCSTASGGFKIRKPHGEKYLTLSFCIEEVTSQYGEENEDV